MPQDTRPARAPHEIKVVSWKPTVQLWLQRRAHDGMPECEIPEGYYAIMLLGLGPWFMVCAYGRNQKLQPHIELPAECIAAERVVELLEREVASRRV